MSIVHIVARMNGVGIDRDVAIMQNLIDSFATVDCRSQKHPESWTNQLISSVKSRTQFGSSPWQDPSKLYLLTERIPRLIGRLGGQVAVVPNQERFPHRHISRLKKVDVVLCKTKHAQQVFSDLGCETEYIGFTSIDRNLAEIQPDYDRFFHLAGRSTLKGTDVVLEAWSRHPQWPILTLVQSGKSAPKSVPANVNLITDYLSDSDLQRLQNEHGVHLCPSQSEGWGHYIVEAMSCSALTITTDGPPMNELVTADRGILVPWATSQPRHLGTNWIVNAEAIEAAVDQSLQTPASEKAAIGAKARAWYESNDTEFRQRFSGTIRQLLGLQRQA